jgi:hypothetical protein
MATATRTRARVKRTGFENRTQGFVGVVKIDRKGDEVGKPVEPGARVFLTDEEIELTRQAPAHADNSPFAIREIVHFEQGTGEEIARFHAAPLSKIEDD